MDKWLYFFIDLGAIFIPFIAGFDNRLKFQKQWKLPYKTRIQNTPLVAF